jgi:hypothetical protein
MFRPNAWNDFLRFICIAPTSKKRKHRVARRERLESRCLLSATVSVSTQQDAGPGGMPGTFDISIFQTQMFSVTVNYSLSGSALDDSSIPTSGTATLNPGMGDTQVSITPSPDDGDNDAGSPESLTLTITNVSGQGVTIGNASATMNVNESDGGGGGGSTPSITVTSNSPQLEGSPITFTINYANMPANATIDYSTQDGTAVAGIDYSGISGSFGASGSGQTSIMVGAFDDGGTGESTQYFTLNVTGGGASGSATAQITEDNDGGGNTPLITVTSNSPQQEGSPVAFTISYANMPVSGNRTPRSLLLPHLGQTAPQAPAP